MEIELRYVEKVCDLFMGHTLLDYVHTYVLYIVTFYIIQMLHGMYVCGRKAISLQSRLQTNKLWSIVLSLTPFFFQSSPLTMLVWVQGIHYVQNSIVIYIFQYSCRIRSTVSSDKPNII